MVDRKLLLQDKIYFQKTKNLMSKIRGIKVLGYENQNTLNEKILKSIGFYNNIKVADSIISYSTKESDIVEWIINLVNFDTMQAWYIWVNSFLVKFQIVDIRVAILDLWNNINPDSKGLVFINENKDMMYEFGNDSRDEYNILFDKYLLNG